LTTITFDCSENTKKKLQNQSLEKSVIETSPSMGKDKIGEVELPKGFVRRYGLIFVGLAGFAVMHLAWWKFVENHVPAEERPKQFEFLGQLEPFKAHEEKK